jgi:hypothetical protein
MGTQGDLIASIGEVTANLQQQMRTSIGTLLHLVSIHRRNEALW